MRDCTRKIVRAWASRQPAKTKNTRTDGWSIWLHGNEIVRRENYGIGICLSGWPTPTTLDRINAVLDEVHATFRLCRHKGEVRAFPVGMLINRLTPKHWYRMPVYHFVDIKEVEMWLNNKTVILLDEVA